MSFDVLETEEEKGITNLSLDNNYINSLNISINKNPFEIAFPNNKNRNQEITLSDKSDDIFQIIKSFPFFTIDYQLKDKIKKNDNFFNKENQKLLFKIKKFKKRGRYPKGLIKKAHNNKTFDNLQRKIHVHFLSFVINISNDVLKSELKSKEINFKKFSYEQKQVITYDFFNNIKKSTIKELILLMKISPKYSNYEDDINKKTIKRVCLLSQWINNFFNINILELFKYYYNRERPLNKFEFEGEEINLSKSTKSFYYLLKKYDTIQKELIDTLKRAYFNVNLKSMDRCERSLLSSSKV